MTPIECVMMSPIGRLRLYLRRYSEVDGCPIPYVEGGTNYHSAMVFLKDVPEIKENGVIKSPGTWDITDSRWPKSCPCGYEFSDTDHYQLFSLSLWKNEKTGDILTDREFPIGAMWDAWWFGDSWVGPDGLHLYVVCPGGDWWLIDGPAGNCDNKEDSRHRCWTRSGTAPKITVGKDFGLTCGAGGGSIQTKNWHGFLKDGYLIQ